MNADTPAKLACLGARRCPPAWDSYYPSHPQTKLIPIAITLEFLLIWYLALVGKGTLFWKVEMIGQYENLDNLWDREHSIFSPWYTTMYDIFIPCRYKEEAHSAELVTKSADPRSKLVSFLQKLARFLKSWTVPGQADDLSHSPHLT